MSVDSSYFLPACRRLIRSRMANFNRGLSPDARTEVIEEEAQSLAYALAEVAQERIDDIPASAA